MSIQLCVALPEDQDEILKFLRESYYREEPLTIGSEPRQQTFEDEEFSLSNLKYGISIIATETTTDHNNSITTDVGNNKKEKIIGVAIAGPKYPNEADHIMELVDKSKTLKWKKLLKLFALLERKANVFERYNITKAVHLHVLGVNKEWRGKSIGAKLIEKCMEVAKELGFPLLSVDCTSIYTIALAKKLGMECVNTLAFADYRDENKQIFSPPQPHTEIKTFVKLL